jgi:Spy/CpxP family protein refolding chaperone
LTTSRVKAYLALGGMFLLGAVSSAAAYHAFARRDDAAFFSGDHSKFEARRLKAMARELDLDDAQITKVGEIFKKHADERRRLLRQEIETCGGPMNAHRERVDGEIRGVLSPEQRVRFEALHAERRRRLFGESASAPK